MGDGDGRQPKIDGHAFPHNSLAAVPIFEDSIRSRYPWVGGERSEREVDGHNFPHISPTTVPIVEDFNLLSHLCVVEWRKEGVGRGWLQLSTQ